MLKRRKHEWKGRGLKRKRECESDKSTEGWEAGLDWTLNKAKSKILKEKNTNPSKMELRKR